MKFSHKAYIITLVLYFIQSNLFAKEWFYYYRDEKQVLNVNKDVIFVGFKKPVDFLEKKNILKEFHSEIVFPDEKKIEKRGLTTDFIFLAIAKSESEEDVMKLINRITSNENIRYAHLCFNSTNEYPFSYLNRLIIKTKRNEDYNKLEQVMKEHNLSIAKGVGPNIFYAETEGSNILDLCEPLRKTGLFEFVQPDFIGAITLQGGTPNDEYLESQWYLNDLNNANGITSDGINAKAAWNYTKGCSNIKVAVLDIGVKLDHPDLNANLLPGYDAIVLLSGISGPAGWGGVINNQYGNDDNQGRHGTLIAGIIGAVADNNIGLAGIAPECKMIPIRSAIVSATPFFDQQLLGYAYYSNPIIGNETMTSSSIYWAADNGADVLNMSFAYFLPTPSNAIEDAITYAKQFGRGGKGCVMVSSLSSQGSQGYISNQCMRIGSTDVCNNLRKSGSNPCSTASWSSPYGISQPVSLVAPGENIATTDIVTGFSGEYNFGFYGTSASTAMVSATAALLLSLDPNLTENDVVEILESTAYKIPGYNFNVSGMPNGIWNEEVGYGLLDAYAAVKHIIDQRSIKIQNQSLSAPISITGFEIDAGFNVNTLQPTGDVIVTNASGLVSFTANYSVILHEGFNAQSGSTFVASIDNSDFCSQGDILLEGNSDNEVISSGEQEVSESQKITLSPVPANDQIKIHSVIQVNQIEIINNVGNCILSTFYPSTTNEITYEISGLKDGIYFCRITSESGTQVVKFCKISE